MPRSGTSLVEQIIASHPAAHGAGELDFWTVAAHKHEAQLRHGTINDELKGQSSHSAYLALLERNSKDAQRVVDKAPVNADYLGLIHSVFPQARIKSRRSAIRSIPAFHVISSSSPRRVNYTHGPPRSGALLPAASATAWRIGTAVLPPGSILTVPYEQLVDEQEFFGLGGFWSSSASSGMSAASTFTRLAAPLRPRASGRCGRSYSSVRCNAGATTGNSLNRFWAWKRLTANSVIAS